MDFIDNLKELGFIKVLLLCTILIIGTATITALALPQQTTDTPQPTPTTPTNTNQTTTVNTTQLLNSHTENTNLIQPYQLTLTASSPNTTPFHTQQITVQENATYTYTNTTSQRTAHWQTSNQTLQYTYANTTTTQSTPHSQNHKTQSYFLQQILNIGTYEYTATPPLEPTTFTLTEVNNTDALAYAYPGLSGNENHTLSNITINGTTQYGVITSINGSFNYKPPMNATMMQYEFNYTTNPLNNPQPTPQWVTEYNQTQPQNQTQTNTTQTNTTQTNTTQTNTTQTNNKLTLTT